MTEPLHSAATHHLPSFITAPGETDWLMIIMSVFLALSVLMFGILFFRLHSLPERMAHRTHKLQFEIVAVLCLISLFTHMHIFWIVGLLLAMIDLPDFGTPLSRIATSAEKIAGIEPSQDALEEVPGTAAPTSPVHEKGEASLEADATSRKDEGPSGPPTKPEHARARPKEPLHA
jgi:NADH:ubiquinone oxidoreductase subunit 5 (subunit L)/multisubunit Na+/H+ antiporter MnhA subunit